MKFALVLLILIYNMRMSAQTDFKPSLTFSYGNTNINYEIIGSGSIPILFVHGFGLSLNSWNDIKYKFDTSLYKLILIDLKGTGFSAKPLKSDYSIHEQANIVFYLLKSLKIDSTNIACHSYGGIVTLYLHYLINEKKYDLKITKTIFLDTPGYNKFTPFFVKVLKNPILSFFSLKILSPKCVSKNTIKSTFFDKTEAIKRWLPQYEFFFRLKGYDESMVQLAEQLIPDNFEELANSYKKITTPVLIIWGGNDKLIDISQGIHLNKDIPAGTQAVLVQPPPPLPKHSALAQGFSALCHTIRAGFASNGSAHLPRVDEYYY